MSKIDESLEDWYPYYLDALDFLAGVSAAKWVEQRETWARAKGCHLSKKEIAEIFKAEVEKYMKQIEKTTAKYE